MSVLSSARFLAFAALVSASLWASPEAVKPAQPTPLFNGRDLTGWVQFAKDGPPPAGCWTVNDGVIRCSGSPAGYIRTEGRYRDYRLTVEWRWTGPAPLDKEGRPRSRNSGVILHVQPPDAIWPAGLEAQLMEKNAGDFWVIGGVETAEHLELVAQAVRAAGSDEQALRQARGNRRTPKAQNTSEKSVGQWNTYDILCSGDTVTLWVNGVEQNRATGVTVREGHICLQSEGAGIEFRNVTLHPLN
ncbi:MAG: 3-keto-disaccharide hydrolase [Verrucomicrobiota bacterium]